MALATSLTVNLVTPKGVVAQTAADGVTAPGELGEFELLPGHVPMLSALKPGVVVLGTKATAPRFAVSAGYLRVDQTGSVEILVEKAVRSADVDVDVARKELAAAEAELEKWGDRPVDGDHVDLVHRVEWARARIDAASH